MSLVLDKFDNKANKGRKKRKIKKILFHKILYQLLYILKSQPAFQLPCAWKTKNKRKGLRKDSEISEELIKLGLFMLHNCLVSYVLDYLRL